MSAPDLTVRVFECSNRHRRLMTEIGLDALLRHVRHVTGNKEAEGLEHDLRAEGRARIDGTSLWFEYEQTDP